ncbi:DNA topoisomerase, putative [Bodo saltans]|uniref:DNA topoisomerase n=1 Tax=Bodo saltans TaxID=75058 RepID=A0A0S4JI21_BODSA|nr:DNA topoisomerase, putative [Bodo saltans]|eukprot:CUG90018.1 DNA topoisomerase, putative [Bodo saltans]
MPVWLNVAEKPSVAKEVSMLLSKGQCRTTQSQSRFNPVFEFRLPTNQSVEMLFTSVAGHLTEDELPPQTKSWGTYPLPQLFTVPISRSVKEEFQGAKKNLETLAKKSNTVVLWLDCDREGENICFEVLDVVQAVNRRLEVKRARFSALTERDLLHAVTHLVAPNKHLSEAVEARREMDLRIGAVFTRLQTVKFRERFEHMPRVLSFGPCQFPTLGFVVQRFWEREAFVAEDFYTGELRDGETMFKWSYERVFDAAGAVALFEDMMAVAEAEAIAQPALDAASEELAPAAAGDAPVRLRGTVSQVQQKQSQKFPPAPLNTVELQKLASQHLRISAENCMTIAESLYQQGFLSYPRTETDEFTFTDDELVNFAAIHIDNPAVSDFAQRLVQRREENYRRPRSGGHNDHAHPPIHPLRFMPSTTGDQAAQNVYLLVVRHFLACMSPPAIAAATHVDVTFGEVRFHTSGQTVVSRGWLDVFPYERWGNSTVPNYQEGQLVFPTDMTLRSGRTEAPQLLTEAQLITTMDANGIGTDATIAQHIKTVVEREYVVREGSILKPSALGIALVSAYEVAGLGELVRPTLRAQMELAMGDIARGEATKQQVLDAAVEMYKGKLQQLMSKLDTFEEELCRHLTPMAGGGGGGALNVLQGGFTACGRCGAGMDLLQEAGDGQQGGGGRTGYLRCQRCTPALMLRIPLHAAAQLTPTQHRCPLCQFFALSITNTERGTMYNICPYCFTHPPASAVGDLEQLGGEFRCFQCIAECPLAKGIEQLGVAKCPVCPETLRLRSTAQGRVLSCRSKTCSFLVSLPSAESVRPIPTDRCASCGGIKCRFTFNPAQLLPGIDSLEEVMCIACDYRLKDYLIIRGGNAAAAASTATAPTTSAAVTGTTTAQALAAYSMPTVPKAAGRGGAGSRGGRGGRGRGGAAAGAAGAAAGAVMCECGVGAKRLTSRQQASSGREFLTCGNNRACGFFQWLDGQ